MALDFNHRAAAKRVGRGSMMDAFASPRSSVVADVDM